MMDRFYEDGVWLESVSDPPMLLPGSAEEMVVI